MLTLIFGVGHLTIAGFYLLSLLGMHWPPRGDPVADLVLLVLFVTLSKVNFVVGMRTSNRSPNGLVERHAPLIVVALFALALVVFGFLELMPSGPDPIGPTENW